MSESVHGHAVLEMMIASGASYSRESLVQAIEAQFGAGTRFHTCSAEGMSASELVDFLEQRKKFIPKADGFTTAAERICKH